MDRQSAYLHIPTHYCRWLGGLRWDSSTQNLVEHEDGSTFAFGVQIGLFIEGFCGVRSLIHFGHILHLLYLLGHARITPPWQALELSTMFRETGKPLRNAGALCGHLCRAVPPLAEPADTLELCRRLSSSVALPAVYSSWVVDPFAPSVEAPPLEPAAFERVFLSELARFQPEDVSHWLRHGRAPLGDGGRQIAEEFQALQPRTLTAALAALLDAPRLAAAMPYVAQLVSALTLPPRRLSEPELPMGGYADVATRGEPERILPSQFAMDEMEFIRRFAAQELLYFRREEPQAQTREELVVLLDQGVRTWGTVRLLLCAAAFALGKLAARKKLTVRFAATSSEGRLLDPLQVNDSTLRQLLEASDLSANPGMALEHVLNEAAATPRDVVLLTQHRNLSESNVLAAARRAGETTRLFSVSADAQGLMQLASLKQGTPVKLTQFQVNLRPEPEVPVAVRPHPRRPLGEPLPPWQGDVEPVGFPFRMGITGPLQSHLFDFDVSGHWLLAIGYNGMLHACRVDGTCAELVPRPFPGGRQLSRIYSVTGVIGGFVLCGRQDYELAAVHYDLASRRCQTWRLGLLPQDILCNTFYSTQHHTCVIRLERTTACIDLATGKLLLFPPPGREIQRVQLANEEALELGAPPPRLFVSGPGTDRPKRGDVINLDPQTGVLTIDRVNNASWSFVPRADGQPLLAGCRIARAVLGGSIVAATFFPLGRPDELTLRLFHGPRGLPLYEHRPATRYDGFALSRDGKRLAVQSARGRTLRVHDVERDCAIIFATPKARFDAIKVSMGDDWIVIHAAKRFNHLIRWRTSRLEQVCWTADEGDTRRQFNAVEMRGHRSTLNKFPQLLAELDSTRWIAGVVGKLQVGVDCFGQVAVLGLDNKLICMFRILHDQIAAWMPDGTRYGKPRLSGGPETPNALEKIAAALRAASKRGGGRAV
jgi:hypothetical protein